MKTAKFEFGQLEDIHRQLGGTLVGKPYDKYAVITIGDILEAETEIRFHFDKKFIVVSRSCSHDSSPIKIIFAGIETVQYGQSLSCLKPHLEFLKKHKNGLLRVFSSGVVEVES